MSGDQRRAEPLSDEEYSDLGKSMGMLFQRIMRSRKEPEGGHGHHQQATAAAKGQTACSIMPGIRK